MPRRQVVEAVDFVVGQSVQEIGDIAALIHVGSISSLSGWG
jgi:hypothetical protein